MLAVAPRPFHPALRAALGPGASMRARPPPARGDDPYGLRRLARRERPDGIVLVAPPTRGLGAAAPGPLAEGVPVGVVQAAGPRALAPWLAAVRASRARDDDATWALLAMRKPFFLGLSRVVARGMRDAGAARFASWTADRVTREELCARLARGPRLAVYVGHGRPRGWSGYQGLRSEHLAAAPTSTPCGAVVALSCDTLGLARGGREPFGHRWVSSGGACAYVGSVTHMLLGPGEEVARALAAGLATGRLRTLGALLRDVEDRLAEASPAARETFAAFRVAGDPLQRLA